MTSSDGWNEMPPSEIQLRAPLFSCPNTRLTSSRSMPPTAVVPIVRLPMAPGPDYLLLFRLSPPHTVHDLPQRSTFSCLCCPFINVSLQFPYGVNSYLRNILIQTFCNSNRNCCDNTLVFRFIRCLLTALFLGGYLFFFFFRSE